MCHLVGDVMITALFTSGAADVNVVEHDSCIGVTVKRAVQVLHQTAP